MSLQQQLYDKIIEHVAPGKDFLLNKTTVNWDWPKKVGYIDTKEYQLVGTMPAVPDAVGPFYASSAIDIYRQYVTTLNSVKLEVSAEHQQQLNQLNEAIDAIIAKDQATWVEYKAALAAANPSPEDLDMWKKMNGWDLKLTTNDKEREALQQKKVNITAISNADFTSALAAINNKEGFTQMLKAGAVAKVPNYLVSDNGIDWRDKVAGGKGTVVSIKLSSSSDYKSTSKRQFTTTTSFLFFTSTTTNEREEVDVEKTKTSIQIDFESLSQVTVTPDADWFHQPYLNKIAQQGNMWRDGRTNEEVFGPNGFHSIVTGYVVGYRPTFRITTSSYNSQLITTRSSSGFGISLGPFSFGIGSSSSNRTFTCEQEGGEVIITSKSEYAQIVGVIMQPPNVIA